MRFKQVNWWYTNTLIVKIIHDLRIRKQTVKVLIRIKRKPSDEIICIFTNIPTYYDKKRVSVLCTNITNKRSD